MRRIEQAVGGRDELVAASMVVGESRRVQADTLLWEIPALALTAQAFLFTIALDPDASDAARAVANFTALIFVGAAYQSLLKHRYHEGTWARWLERFERQLSLPRLNTPETVRAVARGGSNPDLETPRLLYTSPLYLLRPHGLRNRVFRGSAFRVWAGTLVVVMAIDFAMMVVALFGISGILDSPFANSSESQARQPPRSAQPLSPRLVTSKPLEVRVDHQPEQRR